MLLEATGIEEKIKSENDERRLERIRGKWKERCRGNRKKSRFLEWTKTKMEID